MKAMVVRYNVNEDTKLVGRDIKIIDAPIKDNLEFMYEHIGCDSVDVVYFDGFDFWVDDNGLITAGNVVVEYSPAKGVMIPLAGNIIVSKGADNLGRTQWFNTNEGDDLDLMENIIEMIKNGEIKGVTQ